MDWRKGLAIGCGGCLLLAALAAVATVSCVGYLGTDPEGVQVTVTAPLDVIEGEVFELVVEVANQRRGDAFGLTDIDLADEYLEGFTLLRTVPDHRSSMHVPIDASYSFSFDHPVLAGETARFVFELEAGQPGSYRGDLDVCEGLRFLSKMLQTRVHPASAGAEAGPQPPS